MDYKLTIGWLYPELMSTYGDRGNIIVLEKRCSWRGIDTEILPIDFKTTEKQMKAIDIFFGGGAQDRQQAILIDDLTRNKGPVMKQMIEDGTPGIFVCGSPQLLGKYYITGDGKRLDGLSIFDMISRHPGTAKPRCIGNIIARIDDRFKMKGLVYKNTIVGFENHGGRTYLGNGVKPFGTVLIGCGNNGEDKTEGAIYKNCIATYSHGPFLPRNPHIADYLIGKALKMKYQKKIKISQLDDAQEWQAHDWMLKKLGVQDIVTPI